MVQYSKVLEGRKRREEEKVEENDQPLDALLVAHCKTGLLTSKVAKQSDNDDEDDDSESDDREARSSLSRLAPSQILPRRQG